MLGRRIQDLRVEFDGRGLVLHGRAESYYAKQLAQHVVMTVVGLPLSVNKIVVADSRRGMPATGKESRPTEPEPHTAEPNGHTTRVAPGGGPDDTPPGDDRVAGQSS
jgi:hypothetical protein